METKRQRRRRDILRMKVKAARIYPNEPKAKQADYLAVCSCWMCGNPRRMLKGTERITVQERRADLTVSIDQSH